MSFNLWCFPRHIVDVLLIICVALISSSPASSAYEDAIYGFAGVSGQKEYINGPLPDSMRTPAGIVTPVTWNKSNPFFCILSLIDITFPGVDGPNALSIQKVEATRHVISQINADNSCLPNTKLVYDIIDCQSLSELALGPTLDHMEQRDTIAIVGPPSSTQAYVIGAATEAYDVSFISSTATSAQLPKTYKNRFLQFAPNDKKLLQNIILTIRAMGWNLIAPLFSSDDYGLFGRSSFIAAAQTINIHTTCDGWIMPPLIPGSITPDAENVANSFSACVSDSDLVNVVFLFMDYNTAAYVISVLYSTPNNERLTFVATDAWYDFRGISDILSIYNVPVDYLNGTITLLPHPGNYTDFENYFSSLNPENTCYSQFLQYWQTQFKCIYNSTNESIPICGDDYSWNTTMRTFPPDCRCTGQENLSSVDLDYSVVYIYDMIRAIALGLDQIINHCDMLPDQSICSKESITGSDLHQVMSKLVYDGHTGIVAFRDSARIGSQFSIYQTRFNAFVEVGTCLENVVRFNNNSLLFKNGQSSVSSSIEYAPIVVPYTEPIVFVVMSVLVIVVALLFMLILFLYKKHPIIMKSSPLFCQLMLVGIILLALGVLLDALEPTTLLCVLIVWLPIIGIGLILANLMAKSYRIMKVYSTLAVPSSSVSDVSLLKFTFAVLVVEIVLLCVYSFAYGLLEPQVVQSQVDPLYSYPTCVASSGDFPLAPVIIILSFNAIIVGLLGIMAYLTRRADSAYNESKHIAIVIYSYLFIAVLAIPLYFGRQEGSGSAEQRYLIQSIALILLAIVPLVVLIAPKVVAIMFVGRRASETDSHTIEESRIAEISSERMFKRDFLTREMWRNRIHILEDDDRGSDTQGTITMMVGELYMDNSPSGDFLSTIEDTYTSSIHSSDTASTM